MSSFDEVFEYRLWDLLNPCGSNQEDVDEVAELIEAGELGFDLKTKELYIRTHKTWADIMRMSNAGIHGRRRRGRVTP